LPRVGVAGRAAGVTITRRKEDGICREHPDPVHPDTIVAVARPILIEAGIAIDPDQRP
jgi:hypothetical protein